MSLPLIAKVGIGVIAAGGTGVAGWQVISYINAKETVASYLSRKGRKMASSESDWRKLHTFYQSEKKDSISGLERSKANHSDIEKWCLKETSSSFKESREEDLLLIESWCSEPKTLEEWIALSGKRKLSTDTQTNSGDQSVWSTHKETYKTEGDKYKIQQQQNSGSTWTDVAKANATEDLMKKWCKAQETKHFKHQKDVLFRTYSKWCVVDIKASEKSD